jgi:hypothetical protein
MSLNRKQRYGTFAAVTFTAALVATLALVPAMDQQAFAKKPNPDFENAERIFGFNYIGLPKGNESAPAGQCLGNHGNNVYTVRGTGGQHIHWDNTDNTGIVDHCTEKVDGNEAIINIDAEDLLAGEDGQVFYTVRMLGKPGGELKFCKETITEFNGGDHCVIGVDPTETFTRDRGQPSFSIPKALFDVINEDIVWHSQTNSDFRIAQIDVWFVPLA